MHYRVIVDTVTVYRQPRHYGILYQLSHGAIWVGHLIEGSNWRGNNMWVRGFDGYVWRGALEPIDEQARGTVDP